MEESRREVTPEVSKLLRVLQGVMSRSEIMALRGLKDEKHFREGYPDTPQSRFQKYRLSPKGRAALPAHRSGKSS